MTYEEWMNEIEVTGTRFERFLNEWDTGMDVKRMEEWLKSAYQMGLEHNAAEVERLKEYEWMYKDLCE